MSQVEVKDSQISYKLGNGTRNVLFGMIAIGVASFLAAFFTMGHEPARFEHSNPAWSALLVGTFLILAVSITGIFYTAISNVAGAVWSISTRRIAENMGMVVPLFLGLLVITFFGLHDLFEWSHAGAAEHDHLIKHKSAFLNVPFIAGSLIIFTIVWTLYARKFRAWSIERDNTDDIEKKAEITKLTERMSARFILVFAITFSITAFELLMSLAPHWFSTMFGVYIFGGAYQTFFAVMAVTLYFLKKQGYLGEAVNENHLHDIGKYMLGMTVFWAYTGFSQFMLIWYANIPEETFYYEQRLTGGWFSISIIMIFLKFIIPFFLLLNRPNKRSFDFMMKMGFLLIFAEIFELFWLVFPANFVNFNAMSLVYTIGVSVGTLGIYGFALLKIMEKSKMIPVGDIRINESFNHHQ